MTGLLLYQYRGSELLIANSLLNHLSCTTVVHYGKQNTQHQGIYSAHGFIGIAYGISPIWCILEHPFGKGENMSMCFINQPVSLKQSRAAKWIFLILFLRSLGLLISLHESIFFFQKRRDNYNNIVSLYTTELDSK